MIQEFFFAAWPLVACGLMVAFVCVVWMCIGSMFLCLGAVEMNKVKKNKIKCFLPQALRRFG